MLRGAAGAAGAAGCCGRRGFAAGAAGAQVCGCSELLAAVLPEHPASKPTNMITARQQCNVGFLFFHVNFLLIR